MTEVEVDRLKQAVESMHGGAAQLSQSVPVRKTFEGKPLLGRRGARLRFDRSSDRDACIWLVLADPGKHEAAVLRRVASAAGR